MAFKATIPATEQAFDTIRRVLRDLKRVLQDNRALLLVNPVTVTPILGSVRQIVGSVNVITPLKTTPGLAQYAKDQVSDQNYDIVAEYQAAETAILDLRNSLTSLFPKDGAGYLLYEKFNADGSIDYRTFTPVQVASLIPIFDAAIASIE